MHQEDVDVVRKTSHLCRIAMQRITMSDIVLNEDPIEKGLTIHKNQIRGILDTALANKPKEVMIPSGESTIVSALCLLGGLVSIGIHVKLLCRKVMEISKDVENENANLLSDVNERLVLLWWWGVVADSGFSNGGEHTFRNIRSAVWPNIFTLFCVVHGQLLFCSKNRNINQVQCSHLPPRPNWSR